MVQSTTPRMIANVRSPDIEGDVEFINTLSSRMFQDPDTEIVEVASVLGVV